MNQNDASYSNGRRRSQRRNERKVVRKNEHRNERQKKSKEKRNSNKESYSSKKFSVRRMTPLQKEIKQMLQKELIENENAIKAFRSETKVCEICGRVISPEDIGSAVSNRETGNPAHFDCVLKQISERESPGPNEKVTYIGQGKFAVLHFENPHDLKRFTIRRTIEWEDRDNRLEWRNEMAGLFSQIK
jgi:hypothetical protein